MFAMKFDPATCLWLVKIVLNTDVCQGVIVLYSPQYVLLQYHYTQENMTTFILTIWMQYNLYCPLLNHINTLCMSNLMEAWKICLRWFDHVIEEGCISVNYDQWMKVD